MPMIEGRPPPGMGIEAMPGGIMPMPEFCS